MAEWFGIDELDEIHLAENESVYLSRLRARTANWPPTATPADTCTMRFYCGVIPEGPRAGDLGDPELFVALSMRTDNFIALTVGAYFDAQNGYIVGDRLNMLFLPDAPTVLAMEATGTPDELAERTASWFETLLRRRIVRQEWRRFGRVHTRRWVFSDNGYQLAEEGTRSGDLGPADRTVTVRGDLTRPGQPHAR